MKKTAPKTIAVITQNALTPAGEPGKIEQAFVRSFSVTDGLLCGNDEAGKTIVVVPLSDVANAQIVEASNG